MEIKKIMKFLKGVAKNNNRPWFQEHKDEYEEARKSFEDGIQKAILRIAEFDSEVEHLTVKDCVYRFYRDIRFSPDKSPYKRHFGAYICSKGRKSLRGGYYIHVEPGQCLVATGCYYLPTNILTSCRNEIMGNTEEWLKCVKDPQFIIMYGDGVSGEWEQDRGFGIAKLKTAPVGFPKDYEYIEYLRMKDYCCWHRFDDNFFDGDNWIDKTMEYFKTAKPMMDFVNNVVDDYI